MAPCAIVVPPESPVRRPEDLAGVPIGVGYHSGSHFATLQALEGLIAPGEVALTFQGPPNERLDTLLERQVAAATMWGVPARNLFPEQPGSPVGYDQAALV